MESLFGFNETTSNLDENHKLVPWLNWEEWDFVRVSLFSSSHDSIAKALHRITAWQSRGCLPVAIEITAALIETQQLDPHFRVDMSGGTLDSDEMLSMLYTMSIMRLVNGIIEKTRKARELSIAEAAAEIGFPRMLIDIRHGKRPEDLYCLCLTPYQLSQLLPIGMMYHWEPKDTVEKGSHRDIPALQLLRLASIKAVNWLKSYYWDPQKDTMLDQRSKSANVRKEIRSRFRELAFNLKVKGKRTKHHEPLIGAMVHGRNKLFSLMASKIQSSVGSKKQLTKTLKNLVRLYSSFSSDVVSVLLEILLKASNLMDMVDSPDNFQINLNLEGAQAVFDEWEPVITKLSNKEPELLLSLLKTVLYMIESRKAIRDNFGSEHFSLSQFDSETERIGVLSSLFASLVLVLQVLKPPHNEGQGSQVEDVHALPKPTLMELMRRCLHISDPENRKLLSSAMLISNMAGNSFLNDKLNKMYLSYSMNTKDNPLDVKAEDITHQNKHIRQAAKKLELIKQHRIENAKGLRTRDDNVDNANVWSVAKSWNPCPIGMLPSAVGSSGCLPVLDYGLDYEHKAALNSAKEEEHVESRHCGKREATCDIETMDDCNLKRMKETQNCDFSEIHDTNTISMSSEGLKGQLLIGGVWQKVGDEELEDIKSRIDQILADRVVEKGRQGRPENT